jgi:hypothetical protein
MFLPTKPNLKHILVDRIGIFVPWRQKKKTDQETPFSTERKQRRKFGENKCTQCMHLIIENDCRWS